MKKIKYFFNTHTLRFEKIEVPLKVRLLQTIGFVIASLAVGVLFVAILFKFIDSPKERLLRQQNTAYKESYAVLQERMKQLELQMLELEQRDNEVYRSIFEATPIPDSARVKDMLAKNEIRLIQSLSNTALIENMRNQLNNLSLRMSFQDQSFTEITVMVKNKEKLLTFGDNYLLFEFSFHSEPSQIDALIFEMITQNYKPVLAHFERYVFLHGSIDKATEWREKGVNIQLNYNSLTGHYGPEVLKQARKLVDSGQIDFVATDCHRIEHLMTLEDNLSGEYFHKLGELSLKNSNL